jgi:hypothetical protein
LGNALIPTRVFCGRMRSTCRRVRYRQSVVGVTSPAPEITSNSSLRKTPVAESKSFSAYPQNWDRAQTDATKCERTQRLSACVRSRVGVFKLVAETPIATGFSLKPHVSSNLAFADAVVASHRFASICGFCKRNDTRNDTRRECRLSRPCVKTSEKLSAEHQADSHEQSSTLFVTASCCQVRLTKGTNHQARMLDPAASEPIGTSPPIRSPRHVAAPGFLPGVSCWA